MYRYIYIVTFLISKWGSFLDQTITKIKYKVKWMVKFVKA